MVCARSPDGQRLQGLRNLRHRRIVAGVLVCPSPPSGRAGASAPSPAPAASRRCVRPARRPARRGDRPTGIRNSRQPAATADWAQSASGCRFASMLLDLVPIGMDMPVPISLPGRAPVAGLAPGGTPCGVLGSRLSDGGHRREPASTVDGQGQGTHWHSPSSNCVAGNLAIGHGTPQLWRAAASAR